MKVFVLAPDIDYCQWVMPSIEESSRLDLMTFDCVRKSGTWPAIDWFIYNPKKKRSNFFTMGGCGAFAFDERAYDSLGDHLEMAGEILPIRLETGEPLYVLNVLECANALNTEGTVFDIYPDGTRGRILKYAFHASRLPESSIFKIPETSRGEILTYSGRKSSEDEFLANYRTSGLTGLTFVEL